MFIGYVQGSTADQNPDRQIDALLRADIDRDNIHVDEASGAKPPRTKLALIPELLCESDAPKVTQLDRLSRSTLHLVAPGGPRVLGMLPSPAKFFCELIVANTDDGRVSARARDRFSGRPAGERHPSQGFPPVYSRPRISSRGVTTARRSGCSETH
ncbi:recombinase family protein [Streptomyces sp. M2CJ-2]|nr:recombinase family protein [Streptomyces sp. M2CJ-2]